MEEEEEEVGEEEEESTGHTPLNRNHNTRNSIQSTSKQKGRETKRALRRFK